MLPLLALPVLLLVQAPQAPPLKVEKLGGDVYALSGSGGNMGLVVTARYAVLIDDQFERTVPVLRETIRGLTDKPLRYLINTHHHGDHVGGNALLAKEGAIVVAHSNVFKRMTEAQAALDPTKRGGLPELSLGDPDPALRARLDLRLDGREIHLLHTGAAHTDGDVIVGIPEAKVLAMGDLYFNGMLPFIDLPAGGSFDGLVNQLDQLASWLPADVKIIPGHGPVCGKPDLLRYRDFLKAVQAHAKANPKQDPKALAESFDAKPWSEWKPNPAFVTFEALFGAARGVGTGRAAR
jgi:cyclase